MYVGVTLLERYNDNKKSLNTTHIHNRHNDRHMKLLYMIKYCNINSNKDYQIPILNKNFAYIHYSIRKKVD